MANYCIAQVKHGPPIFWFVPMLNYRQKKSPLIERAKTTSVEGNKSRELMSNRRNSHTSRKNRDVCVTDGAHYRVDLVSIN